MRAIHIQLSAFSLQQTQQGDDQENAAIALM